MDSFLAETSVATDILASFVVFTEKEEVYVATNESISVFSSSSLLERDSLVELGNTSIESGGTSSRMSTSVNDHYSQMFSSSDTYA